MLRRNTGISLLLCALKACVALAHATGYYSIISPGTVHPNSKYTVAVSVHQVMEPCRMKLTLAGSMGFEQEKTVTVNPRSMQSVEFEVPDLERDAFTLKAEGISGLFFSNSTELNYQSKRNYVYVQTDKATYKPGDLVQFRVIFLDDNLGAAQIIKPITISLRDAAKNLIQQYHNVTLSKGVFRDSVKLCNSPVLGTWLIEVQINGNIVQEKGFKVSKYILPHFEVSVEVPSRVWAFDEQFEVVVRARYTYGEWVKGKATVEISSILHNVETSTARKNIAQKTATLQQKSNLEFNLKDLLPNQNITTSQTLALVVTVEEALTGDQGQTSVEIQVVPYRYIIEAPDVEVDCYDEDTDFNYTVSVRDLENKPIINRGRSSLRLTLDLASPQLNITYEAFLNKNGFAVFQLQCIPSKVSDYTYVLRFRNQQKNANIHFTGLTNNFEYFIVNVLKKTLKLGDEIEVEVRSASEELTDIGYVIIGNGNIVSSGTVNLKSTPGKRPTFTVPVAFEMMPKAQLYAYTVVGGRYLFNSTSFYVEKRFLNSISIEALEQVKPGDEITLNVRACPDSYVGLLGVDQSVLLLRAGNDFDAQLILNNIHNLETSVPPENLIDRLYPGRKVGLSTITNAHHLTKPRKQTRMGGGGALIRNEESAVALKATSNSIDDEPLRVRKHFPETWFFDEFNSTSKCEHTIMKTVPDTITSWIVTGFSINSETGFALTDESTVIQSFRAFFINVHLPYSVKRGELVTIPVFVFNYMHRSTEVEVTLDNDQSDFEFVDNEDGQRKRRKQVIVTPYNVTRVQFTIRPKRVGYITLKLKAITARAGDAIQKELKVEAEGVTVFKNIEIYIKTPLGHTFEKTIHLNIPSNIEWGSERINMSVMGDVMSSTVENLEELVRMPHGCGEQNMIHFVPNILVLRYLNTTRQLHKDIEDKAKHFLKLGYQQQLKFMHRDGSFSTFGERFAHFGSTWLTAYVVRTFHQSAKYIDVDSQILERGLDFLASRQAADGSFSEKGTLLVPSHQSPLGMTAFVLLAFLENEKLMDKYATTITLGFQYLQTNIKPEDDLYALSIALYALELRDLPVPSSILAKVNAKAKVDGNYRWWTSDDGSDQTSKVRSSDIEITGYILMALLERNESVSAIAKWLMAQRNSNGGFISTQDTVVGLQALISFIEKTGGGYTNWIIDYRTLEDVDDYGKFVVNEYNALTLQTVELSNAVRTIVIKGTGSGTAVLQVSYSYNIVSQSDEEDTYFKVKVNQKSTCSCKLKMEVCVEFVPCGSNLNKSNMVVMEINLPTGYTALLESLREIEKVENVKLVETRKEDTNVIVYFNSLTASTVNCLLIEAKQLYEVTDQKPVPIVVSDYYDNRKRTIEYFSLTANNTN